MLIVSRKMYTQDRHLHKKDAFFRKVALLFENSVSYEGGISYKINNKRVGPNDKG